MKLFPYQSLPRLIFHFNLAIFVVMIFSVGLALPIQTARAACEPTKGGIILNVPIPGVGTPVGGEDCNKYEIKPGKSGEKESPPQLVAYIKGMYKFFVGIAGILAVFMLMFGGVQWLFSGGNASKIASAKETIFGAVIGLILALGSYTLLVTINPRLVNLTLNLGTVQPFEDCYKDDDSLKDPKDIPCGQICEPKAGGGTTVIGFCDFCAGATENFKHCGEFQYPDYETKSDGNCSYTYCPDFDNACIYGSEYNTNISVDTDYKPHCGDKIDIKALTDTHHIEIMRTCSLDNGKGDLGVGPYSGFGQIIDAVTNAVTEEKSCGEIFTSTSAWGQDFTCVIGTLCSNGDRCVIDVSKGYSPTPIQLVSVGQSQQLGHYYEAKMASAVCQ